MRVVASVGYSSMQGTGENDYKPVRTRALKYWSLNSDHLYHYTSTQLLLLMLLELCFYVKSHPNKKKEKEQKEKKKKREMLRTWHLMLFVSASPTISKTSLQ